MFSGFAKSITLCAAALAAPSLALAGPVADRIATTGFTLPATGSGTSSSYCVGGFCSIGPRLYLAPRSDGSYWLGWSGSDGGGRISLLSGSSIASTFVFAGEEIRGLIAHDDGSFAALLRRSADNTLRLSRRSASNAQVFSTAITNSVAIVQQNTGDARLAYGNGRYAAYFSVHGSVGDYDGHEGDQLTYLNDAGGIVSGGWNWGCSHQMAGLVGYHAGMNTFSAICMSDCYASKGILYNNSRNLFAVDGGCNGTVWGQFGQLAAADSSWKLAFVAQDRPSYPAQGVGLLNFTATAAVTPSVKWLTNTTGTSERDPVLARIGTTSPERFLVGWRESAAFKLGVIDAAGNFTVALETVAGIGWGNRDESLRSAPGGKVAWVSLPANSTSLKLHVYSGGAGDAIFTGGFQ
ncbi:hypothetical protein DFR29_115158 [Tahibacter aquaticus]|uniref:Bacterial repeat domain-containing protein n=1 Tax=Tahibacter aquaticus TaxID=520092 RepID=A0A4R6YPM5_9GAMM|nr:hypothetical protein [Tahibacter aquaticus]TDR39768.1 hypothetical protein DFR29_115158 [Tahibacter aquaticus]